MRDMDPNLPEGETSKFPTIPCPPPEDMDVVFDLDSDWYEEED